MSEIKIFIPILVTVGVILLMANMPEYMSELSSIFLVIPILVVINMIAKM